MNHSWPRRCIVPGLLFIVCALGDLGHAQTSSSQDAATVQRVMSAALSRCYSRVNGVNRITFVPPTEEEFVEVRTLGERAVTPLASYLELQPQNDFARLLAVKFLLAINDSSILDALRKAFAENQWEVTRAAALSGMFRISPAEAKPYVERALRDKSELVRRRAEQLQKLGSTAHK